VLDAAGSARCAVMVPIGDRPNCHPLSRHEPERVSSLILLTTTARYTDAADHSASELETLSLTSHLFGILSEQPTLVDKFV
jgi:hypothetical protein